MALLIGVLADWLDWRDWHGRLFVCLLVLRGWCVIYIFSVKLHICKFTRICNVTVWSAWHGWHDWRCWHGWLVCGSGSWMRSIGLIGVIGIHGILGIVGFNGLGMHCLVDAFLLWLS